MAPNHLSNVLGQPNQSFFAAQQHVPGVVQAQNAPVVQQPAAPEKKQVIPRLT